MTNECVNCQHCQMIIFDHPYFGEVTKIVCTNVLDDEMAEIPEYMLFTEKDIPCFTFRSKDAPKKNMDVPVVLESSAF